MTDHSKPQDDADAADPTRQKLESLFKMLRGSDGPTPGDSNSVSQRFRLLRRHASGGLGDIWLAHDEELNREVALKEIQPQFAGHEQSWSRFLREATITGHLEHPGIVPIYALGHHENGQPFYAMRFVQGDSLADAIAKFHRREEAAPSPTERNLQLRKLITRLIDVCNAVAYAHSRSIIHRDLKPANIMLGEFGETLVVDWGLAKSLAEVADETQSPAANVAEPLRDSNDPSCGATRLRETPPTQIGSAIGSPPYMSPEQAAGRLDELGPASDIYSLGATLFELLTGQAPIGAAPAREPRETLSIKDVLQRIQEGRFPRPSTVTPDVPRALEAVCLKAMSLRTADRYASARDLASDLEAWLADEPVTAWTEPLTVRARRWMRRHQTTVVSTAATALVAIGSLIVLAVVVTDRNESLATAKGNLERSNNQLAETNRELAAANLREREQTKLATKRADELDKANQQVKAEAENAKRSDATAQAVFKFFQEKILAAARSEDEEGGLGFDATIRAAVDTAEPQIGPAFQDRPLVEALIRDTLGMTYFTLGEWDLAIRQRERSRQLRSVNLGADHSDTLTSMHDLAIAYQAAGKLNQALPLIELTVETMKEKLGPDHPHTLTGMHSLANAYFASARFNDAILLYKTSSEKSKLGPDHPQTLNTMNNLALAYQANGQLDEALPLYEKTLLTQKAKLGPDHRDTITSMNNLAGAYRDSGRLDLALPLCELTLEKRKSKLGLDHPSTLIAANNLATAYLAVGKTNQAIALLEQALENQTAKLSLDHPDTLTSMNNLAAAYSDADKLDLALPLYKQVVERRTAKLGADHRDTLNSMNNLADAYRATGQLDLALPLLTQTLEKRKAKLGLDHADTLRSMDNLALAYKDAGKIDLALPLHEQTLEKQKLKIGPDHPDTLTSMNNLAMAYKAVGDLNRAIPILKQTLEKRTAKFGTDHPDTISSINNLASAYSDSDRLDLALPLYELTLEKRKSTLGPDHPRTLLSMYNLASAYQSDGKLDMALPLYEETLDKQKLKLGPDHPDTLDCMSDLATAYKTAGRLNEALPLFELTLEMRKTKLGEQHPDTLTTLGNFANGILQTKQPEKALPLFEQFLVGRRRQLGTATPGFAGLLAAVSLDLLKYQQHAAAEPYLRECLSIREKTQPDHWTTFNTKSLLGGSLLGQKKYADAEPLLLAGYEGMKQHEAEIPAQGKIRLTEAIQRLVDLYDATDKKDKAAEWRAKLPMPTDGSNK